MAGYEPDETKRIVSRIQKMLRLAADAGAAEGERDNALRMAHALLAKHNLSLTDVEASSQSNGTTAARSEPRVDTSAEFDGWVWARDIGRSVAELFFCHYLYAKTGKASRQCRHYFVGRVSNSTTAALVAEFVVTAVYREATRHARAQGEGSEYVRSFGWGAAAKIRERVAELKRKPDVPAATPGTSLVLASVYDSESRENNQYIAQRFGQLRTGGRSKATGSAAAVAAGRSYGSSVSLTPQVR